MTKKDENTFETAFGRLEEILEEMNSGSVSLDKALNLYEEADKLIATCNKRLNTAEKKIETLVKNRQGELTLDEEGNPAVEDFNNS